MTSIPEHVYRLIISYIDRLQQEIPVQKVILFGPYALGDYHDDSEIHLAIFSEYFNGVSVLRGTVFLFQYKAFREHRLYLFPFPYPDYSDRLELAKTALEEGIEINII